MPDFIRHGLSLDDQHPDIDSCPLAKNVEQVYRRKHVQRKVIGFVYRDLADVYLEYLTGSLPRFKNRIHDQNGFGLADRKRQVEQDLTDGGPDIERRNFRRQIEIGEQMLDHRRPETVVSNQNITATEY
jgi:hypothetical protein